MSNEVPVEQVDRLLAVEIDIDLTHRTPEKYRAAILAGEWDKADIVQWCARHRLNATRPAADVDGLVERLRQRRAVTSNTNVARDLDEIIAVLSALPSRDDVLEEAAKVADAEDARFGLYGRATRIAAAIRKMKGETR